MGNFKNNKDIKSFRSVYRHDKTSNVKNWFIGILSFLILLFFLPWTQNIKARGNVTTLKQEQRPQEINSPIPGKIQKWWVREGDFVNKGDTILRISEIKEDYLDPNLINQTQKQVDAKNNSINFYKNKVEAAKLQIEALREGKSIKLDQLLNKLAQTENKLIGEKAELEAAKNEYNLAEDQYNRQLKMFNEGLVSKTQLQQRNISFQNALAKKISLENKYAQTSQDLKNVKLEKFAIEQDYNEKINKAEGDLFQSMSQITSSEGDVAKLENAVSNYTIRNGMYYILAPQNGQIVQAKKAGIGEIIKEGERITVIVPNRLEYAVEMFVRPVDLPLISIGQKVRFMFDGFPAIIFSGWPKNSYGTFSGKIVAFENNIGPNGLFRILVAEDSTEKKWPPQLKLGAGAQGIALLKDVPIWYELWRNINGFPADYYQLKEPVSKIK